MQSTRRAHRNTLKCTDAPLLFLEVGAGTQGFMAELEMARYPVLPST